MDNILQLLCHGDHLPRRVKDVRASVSLDAAGNAALQYIVDCPAHLMEIGYRKSPERLDNLWQTTCFELFVRRPDDAAYLEYNFAPSGDWAHYAFSGYRADMPEPLTDGPVIEARAQGNQYFVDVEFLLPPEYRCQKLQVAVTAIVEEAQSATSYWALAHGDGPADFHDPACFIHEVTAAGKA